jgi:hypothetical protein
MRCACTLNTFDTMDYGYLNAIRFRPNTVLKYSGPRTRHPDDTGDACLGAWGWLHQFFPIYWDLHQVSACGILATVGFGSVAAANP